MQTFITDTRSFAHIAKTLDNKRLNKQALEGWQIMLTLLELDPAGNHRDPKGWRNHPAVKMWRGSERALYRYIRAMTSEWIERGYKTTIGEKAKATFIRGEELGTLSEYLYYPKWMENKYNHELLASTHRTALLFKNYEWYSQFNWPEDLGERPVQYQYLWPNDNHELELGTLNTA